jgi:DNA polymerase
MFKFLNKKWRENPIDRTKDNKQLNGKNNAVFERISTEYSDKDQLISILKTINTLEELKKFIENFNGCPVLKKKSNNTVVSSGELGAKLMIIGEAPGEEEDIQKLPFVGVSGKLLTSMLDSLGLQDRYITNCVFWRPEFNRKPSAEEIDICKPLVLKQIELVKPKCILLLGAVALNMMFGDEYTITKYRGKLLRFHSQTVFATFHPSYILRMPRQKEIVLKDLEIVKQFLSK